MTYRASLVVATRQRATQLRAGLDSIRARRYGGLEVVVVDDRSTDETPAVLDEFADLVTIRHRIDEPAAGYRWNPGSVLNLGHSLASCDVVLEQGGEVCHMVDCVTPLLAACEPGVVAISRCHHGPPEAMEDVRKALQSGQYRFPDTIEVTEPKTEAGRWPAPHTGPGRAALYTGAERQAPFLFLGAIHKADFEAVGGYDERRRDRNDTHLAESLIAAGVRFRFVGSAVAFHLAHDKR